MPNMDRANNEKTDYTFAIIAAALIIGGAMVVAAWQLRPAQEFRYEYHEHARVFDKATGELHVYDGENFRSIDIPNGNIFKHTVHEWDM